MSLAHVLTFALAVLSLDHKGIINPNKPRLRFSVAADDRGDWELRVLVNGKEVKRQLIDHEKPSWKDIDLDLSSHQGKEVELRLEAHATRWFMEFGYWHQVRWE
jgi:hypothetical protein